MGEIKLTEMRETNTNHTKSNSFEPIKCEPICTFSKTTGK